MLLRFQAALLLAPLTLSPCFSAPPASSRDAFNDGSDRSGPEIVTLPSGEFRMGSESDEPGYSPAEILHNVAVSAFSIGRFEITTTEYCEFLNDWGNQIDHGIAWVVFDEPDVLLIRNTGGRFLPVAGAEQRPMTCVTWRGALAYCQWLSKRTGRTYRLPTEAEWEYAARAGTDTTWPWGDVWNPELVCASDGAEGLTETAPVGSHPPNPWGLHDTLGNVWEFVMDCTDEAYYGHSPKDDPVLWNPACWTPGIRGGSFADGAQFCRPGHRSNTWWWGPYDSIGFRVVREESPSRWYRPRPLRVPDRRERTAAEPQP